MSAFSGKQDFTGAKSGRKNKGVMRARRQEKREDAEARDILTLPERRRTARLSFQGEHGPELKLKDFVGEIITIEIVETDNAAVVARSKRDRKKLKKRKIQE